MRRGFAPGASVTVKVHLLYEKLTAAERKTADALIGSLRLVAAPPLPPEMQP
jgi:hypothetical protein